MKKHDDYVSGPHDYWIHFVSGGVFGAGVGAWIGGGLFGGALAIALGAAIFGIGFGFWCGKWGEGAWKSISEWVRIWWGGL
jgi:hypothetical protein